MLRALRISNFAVVEEAELHLQPGLSVLTGETGAGKSILVDALGLLLGGRGDAELVRSGCDEAVVEGILDATPELRRRLVDRGYPDLGEELQIRRVIGKGGRGKAYLNGSLVAVGALAELMRGQVDIAGQHEHTRLLDPGAHTGLLDSAGNLGAEVEKFRADFDAVRSVELELEALGGDGRQIRDRLELLRFQLGELHGAELDLAKDRLLDDERKRLVSTEKLRRLAHDAESLLAAEEGSALERVGRALAWSHEGTRIDSNLSEIVDRLEAARAELEEASSGLSRYLSTLEGDPRRLEEVEDRLELLRRLSRKHSTDLEGLIARRDAMAAELDRLENRETAVAELTAERERRMSMARASADRLTEARLKVAKALTSAVQAGLSTLAMGKSRFEVRLARLPALTLSGQDSVELFFNANPGEPLRPLAKVASGGEASRLMLAIKRALAGADGCDTYVLDEADAGVGGAVAEVVGRMLKELSRDCQVLCITHSPQVAAYGQHHWRVEKSQRGGRTRSRLVHLEEEADRSGELARMLSGLEVTPEARAAAQALVRSARRSTRALPKRAPARAEREAAPMSPWAGQIARA